MFDMHRAAQARDILARVGALHVLPARVVVPVQVQFFGGGKGGGLGHGISVFEPLSRRERGWVRVRQDRFDSNSRKGRTLIRRCAPPWRSSPWMAALPEGE